MKPYLVVIILSLVVLVLAIISIILYFFFTRKKMNYLVMHNLYKLVKEEDFYLINNVVLDLAEDISIHIDHLVCGDKFIYLMADRFLNDGIEGSPEDQTIFTYRHGKREEVKNPFKVNEMRSYKLAKYLNWTEDKPPIVLSIVVVNNGLEIFESLKLNGPTSFVVERKNLSKLIKKIESESTANSFDSENLQKMVEHLNHLSLKYDNKLATGMR